MKAKALTKISIILLLVFFFAGCNDDSLITENESANLEKPTLEKVVESTAGHGAVHYTNYSGVDCYQKFSFNASIKDGVTHGILHYFDDEDNLKFQGDINCLNIENNMAVMGGRIINYKWDNDFEISAEYMYFWLKVIDNGEGNNSTPDQTSLVFAPIVDYGCMDFEAYLYEIEEGNIQVKPLLD